jgi:DNA-binding NarL/FixJ family response regulator
MVQDALPIRVLLVEPNSTLRLAILDVLQGNSFAVEACDSLEQVMHRAPDGREAVALVAWQAMGGLLADEHRNHLVKVTNCVRLLVMVPRRWARLLDATDLSAVVAGIVPKPFEAEELVAAIRAAAAIPSEVATYLAKTRKGPRPLSAPERPASASS